MPHLYVSPSSLLPEGGFTHDQTTVHLFPAGEGTDPLFIKGRVLNDRVRLSLLTTGLDLILNRHKRALIQFARRYDMDILKSNLGKFLKDEKGLAYLLGERGLLDFDWGSPRPKCLEIGSGNGIFLNRMARKNPETLFLGTEINGFVLKKALSGAAKHSLKNLWYLKKNALYLLRYFVPEGALDALYIHFPDPWFKKRHHKRKIVNPHSLETFARALRSGGRLYFATDDPAYASWAETHFNLSPFFALENHEFSGRPKFHTKYERKWLMEGKKIHSFCLRRNETPPSPRDRDPLVTAFSVPAPYPLSSGTTLQAGDFTVVFRDVYRGKSGDILDSIVHLNCVTWFVLFTWRQGILHYNPDLNRTFLSRQAKEALADLLSRYTPRL